MKEKREKILEWSRVSRLSVSHSVSQLVRSAAHRSAGWTAMRAARPSGTFLAAARRARPLYDVRLAATAGGRAEGDLLSLGGMGVVAWWWGQRRWALSSKTGEREKKNKKQNKKQQQKNKRRAAFKRGAYAV